MKIFVCLTLCLLTFDALPAEAAEQVVWVDMRRAILGTPDGQRAKAKLAAKHKRFKREIRAKEEVLLHERKRYTVDGYHKAVEEVQKEIREREAALEKEQDQMLAPIVERLEAIVKAQNRGTPKVLLMSKNPPIAGDPKCDLTSWLIRKYAAPKVGPPKPAAPCSYDTFVYVAFDQALAMSAAGKKATRQLDAFKSRSQQDVDRRKKELDEIQRSGKMNDPKVKEEFELKKKELEGLFRKLQSDLRKKEQETEGHLYQRLEAILAGEAKKHPKASFVEIIDAKQKERLSPHCDVTQWAAQQMDAKSPTPLNKACPALR